MAAKISTLTHERLKELLHYDPDTGIFTRIVKTSWNVNVGDIAGCRNRHGYIVFRLDNTLYYGHRLAWLYIHGRWPSQQIDHKNGNKSDNKFVNLRNVSYAGNGQNVRKPSINNKSGFLGVSKKDRKWLAQMRINGKQTSLGVYLTPELAHEAYLTAKRKLHPTCTI